MWGGPKNHGSQEKDGEKDSQEKDHKEASEESRQAVAEKEDNEKEASRQEVPKTSCEEIASEFRPSGVGSTDVQFGGAI